ncbi:hypothetical protein BAG01nite_14060 [Brevibacillus agri]|uniref:Uncharacterized protein n=1 Tax=Brevibacillus agri TaxID=51101 RepID=A0ABQ0SRQ5_9BACL|nr:hypothetical protein BAG01nite_14060 [Brevibacillus agri]
MRFAHFLLGILMVTIRQDDQTDQGKGGDNWGQDAQKKLTPSSADDYSVHMERVIMKEIAYIRLSKGRIGTGRSERRGSFQP